MHEAPKLDSITDKQPGNSLSLEYGITLKSHVSCNLQIANLETADYRLQRDPFNGGGPTRSDDDSHT